MNLASLVQIFINYGCCSMYLHDVCIFIALLTSLLYMCVSVVVSFTCKNPKFTLLLTHYLTHSSFSLGILMFFKRLEPNHNRFKPLEEKDLLVNMDRKPTPPRAPIHEPVPLPLPNLVSHLAEIKYKYFANYIQPGSMVNLSPKTLVHQMFTVVDWEPLIFFRGRSIFPHLIAELYCNMSVYLNEDGEKFLTSFVDNDAIIVTHEIINNP